MFSGKSGCLLRMSIILIIILSLFFTCLSTSQASTNPVDLEIGDKGAVSWDIRDIQPGYNITKTLALHNLGNREGSVIIWISDIKETDYDADGAKLDDYLLLSPSNERLVTNLVLPTTIRDLPSGVEDSGYLSISRLGPGETIYVDWGLEFWETGMPQNDAQGDGLSFSINYMLEELPGESLDEDRVRFQYLKIDILDNETFCKIGPSGRFLGSYHGNDPGGICELEIAKGTRIVSGSGKIPEVIKVEAYDISALPVPQGMEVAGNAYVLRAYGYDSLPCDVIFDQSVKFTLNPGSGQLPINTSSMGVFSYDPVGGWRMLETGPWSGGEDNISFLMDGTGTFAILAKTGTSPYLVVSDLIIEPDVNRLWGPFPLAIRSGESASITSHVENWGEMDNFSIDLIIDGNIVESKKMELGAGECDEVCFVVSGLDEGPHIVEVRGLEGKFKTSWTINWWLLGCMVFCICVIIKRIRKGSIG